MPDAGTGFIEIRPTVKQTRHVRHPPDVPRSDFAVPALRRGLVLEVFRDHPPKGSGPLDGWIWNDTPHSVDGAHVNDREVVFYTEHKNTRQGGGASAIPLATFLDEGPDACNYGAPPETLAALVIHAWLRLA